MKAECCWLSSATSGAPVVDSAVGETTEADSGALSDEGCSAEVGSVV